MTMQKVITTSEYNDSIRKIMEGIKKDTSENVVYTLAHPTKKGVTSTFTCSNPHPDNKLPSTSQLAHHLKSYNIKKENILNVELHDTEKHGKIKQVNWGG
jgi:hypothetical protein